MFTNIRLKVRNFVKRNKKVIIVVLVIWSIIIITNYTLKNVPKVEIPITTYEPHTSVMDSSEVPQKLQNPIENLIKEFINACNAKEYEKAYYLLSDDCRKDLYPELDDFKTYVDAVFSQKKIYNIQNFSNKDDYYIYTVTILNDIMASGTTNEEQLETYEETMVIKEENNNLKLSIRGYIGNNIVDQMHEDDYLKINIENVKVDYETMTYYIKVRNKTDDIIVLDDSSQSYEIALNTVRGIRNLYGLFLEPIIVYPQETKTFPLTFMRFYDEKGDVNSLVFNYVRVLKSYTGTEETRQDEINNATKVYSFSIEL